MIPPVRRWTSLGLVQSSPRDFWTGIGPVQISTGLGRTGTGPVHSDGISPMSLRVSHTLSHWIVSYKRSHVREKERFWLEEHRKRLRGCDRLPGGDEPHKLHGSMKARQECLRNHTHCVDLWKLGKSAWDQELRKIQCVFRCLMRWCLSTPGSPIYILPVAQSISAIPVSPYTPRRLPLVKLSGGGGEKQIFLSRHLHGPVQTEPVQSKTGSLRSSPVRPSRWTGLDWALSRTGIVRTGGIIG